MMRYLIQASIRESLLPQFLQLLNTHGVSYTLRPHQEEHPKPSAPPKPNGYYAFGTMVKDRPAEEIINEILSDGRPHTGAEIGQELAKYKYAKTSASPVLSRMATSGKILRLFPGTYQARII